MRALREQFANDAPRLRSNVRRAASSVERVEEKLESVAVSYVVLALDVESPAYELEDLSLRVPARYEFSRLFTTDKRASIASKSIWSPSTRSRSFRRFDPTPLRLRDMTSARVRYKQRLDSIYLHRFQRTSQWTTQYMMPVSNEGGGGYSTTTRYLYMQ